MARSHATVYVFRDSTAVVAWVDYELVVPWKGFCYFVFVFFFTEQGVYSYKMLRSGGRSADSSFGSSLFTT